MPRLRVLGATEPDEGLAAAPDIGLVPTSAFRCRTAFFARPQYLITFFPE
jgi:hypothetical protein